MTQCAQCSAPLKRCPDEGCWCRRGGADPAVHMPSGSHYCAPGSRVNLRVAELPRGDDGG